MGFSACRRSQTPRAGMTGPRHRGAGIAPAQLTRGTLCAVLAGMIAREQSAAAA